MLHFGYGSNLSSKFLKALLPSANFVMKAYLPNFEVQFRIWSEEVQGGYSSIAESPGSLVHGILYEAPEGELVKMDDHTYYKDLYTRESFLVLGEDQTWQKAELYRLNVLKGPYTPDKTYIQTMIEGAREHDMDPDYLKKIEAMMP